MQNRDVPESVGEVALDETDRLIASDRVEGTAVYNRQAERLGDFYNFMVDKRSGQSSTRSSRSAAFSALATTTFRCRGRR